MSEVHAQTPQPETPPVMTDEEIWEEEVDRRASGDEPGDVSDVPPDVPPEPAVVAEPVTPAAEAQPVTPETPAVEPAAPVVPVAAVPVVETPPAEPVVQPEWYKNLAPEAKVAYDAAVGDVDDLRQRYTALHGRVSPVQQENARLQQQLAQRPATDSGGT